MKYVVKKEFVDVDGRIFTINETTDGNTVGLEQLKGLIDNGFIEPIQENTRWRADINDKYLLISDHRVAVFSEFNDDTDDTLYKYGNYFKSRKTAELVAEALKQFFKYLHTSGNVFESNWKEFNQAMNEGRHAVLKDDGVDND